MTVTIATIHERDTVELLVPLPGAVVFACADGKSFTVEFFRCGETVAIADVAAEQIRYVGIG